MKNTYTSIETITTFDGNTIVYRPDLISDFYIKTFEENFSSLSQEQKEEIFFVEQQYGDLLYKIWQQPLEDLLKKYYGDEWILKDTQKTPTEEYNYQLSANNISGLAMERLKLHSEWFEKQEK